jgi:hypothetical protein
MGAKNETIPAEPQHSEKQKKKKIEAPLSFTARPSSFFFFQFLKKILIIYSPSLLIFCCCCCCSPF